MDGAEPEINMDKFASFNTPGGPASRVMDAFPLMHTTAVHDAQRAAAPDKRVVLLPRSAWAGQQRNGACAWTSDINQAWTTLAWQIEGLQNYSITGLPYVTTDVGGYHPTPEGDRELFLRWFEWGTFCPIFRVHGEGRPYPWEYGAEGESIIKKFDLLRYRLLPYIYSEAARVTFDAGTIMRPLVMDFPNDTQAISTWDEFMFGPSVLVCPVYKSLRESVGTVDSWADLQGKSGTITVTYLENGKGGASSREIRSYMDLTGHPVPCGFTFSTDRQGHPNSLRVEGTFTPGQDGPMAFEVNEPDSEKHPVTAMIDGHSVAPTPPLGPWQFPSFPFQGHEGTRVRFSIETAKLDAHLRVTHILAGPLKRAVYLPGSGGWYDFWTGEKQQAKELSMATPLDIIPLYIKAGTILPMGPEVQYANEQPDAPIELRIYSGADGSYTLYQDEGDNYNYEKGSFAQVPLTWNDKSRTLTIGARKGSYNGMPEQQTFHVIWVSPGHGAGESLVSNSDQTVAYDGHEISISAPPASPK
jgi:alpha-D-xyloside xylohydrolase